MEPLERYVDLVAFLLEARRPVTFEEIHRRMPEAYGQGNLESVKRMFERDKDVIRSFGIPLETETLSTLDGTEGYVIRRDRYYLPQIRFEPEEVAALWIASASPGADEEARLAARKIVAGTDDVEIPLAGGSIGLTAGGGATIRPIVEALVGRRAIGFDYRDARASISERHVDPFGVVARAGRWYLIGGDREREAIRCFRADRIVGAIRDLGEAAPAPEGFRAEDHVRTGSLIADPVRRARVAFEPSVTHVASAGMADARPEGETEEGWIVLSVPLGDLAWLAGWVLSFGERAVALEPRELREEILGRLEACGG